MPGVALFNCIVILFGLILMYNILPETEGRRLEDIELHFSDNSKKITNRKIPKMKSKKKLEKENESQIATQVASVVGGNGINKTQFANGCDNKGFNRD